MWLAFRTGIFTLTFSYFFLAQKPWNWWNHKKIKKSKDEIMKQIKIVNINRWNSKSRHWEHGKKCQKFGGGSGSFKWDG